MRRVLTGIAISLVAGAATAVGLAVPLKAQQRSAPPAKSAPAAKDDPVALLRRVMELFAGGQYAEAIPVARNIIAAFERMGAGAHPMQAQNYALLGDLYRLNGDFTEAERHLRRALAMRETALGPDHADVAASLVALHHLLVTQGHLDQGEQLLRRALAIRERALGADDAELSMTRISLARIEALRGRHEAAEPLIRAALDVFRRTLAPEHGYVGVALNNLADTLSAQGRYGEAEPLLKAAAEINSKTAGPKSPLAAAALNNLAELYRNQGRLAEAEELRRREIAIVEAQGPDSLDLARSLSNFGTLLAAQRRPAEAEALLRRALAIQERRLKPDHSDIAVTLNNLADAVGQRGDRAGADGLLRRSLELRERVSGPEHRSVAVALDNLATSLFEQARFAEAEPLSRRALAINEAQLPEGHPAIAQSLGNLAAVLDALGRAGETHALHERALAMRRAAFGPGHPSVLLSLLNLGSNALDLADWQRAYDILGEAGRLWRQRAAVRGGLLQSSDQPVSGELETTRDAFLGLAVAAERLRGAGADAHRLVAEAFEAMQLSAGSVAAAAHARAGARAAAGNTRLAGLARERQDLAEHHAAIDRQLFNALGKSGSDRDGALIERLRATLGAVQQRAAKLDADLAQEFPSYASLVSPEPLPLAAAQALLDPTEAMVIVAPTRFGTLVLIATGQAARLVMAKPTGKEIQATVAKLRCGLDAESWRDDGARRCGELTGVAPEADLLPFDVGSAHALYASLFSGAEDLVRDKRLLIVASGALSTIPFQVLVTSPPVGAAVQHRLGDVAWLGKRQPLAVLPSVTSLKLARAAANGARPSPKPLLAFANPLLTGAKGDDRSAFARQSCPAIAAAPAVGTVRKAPRSLPRLGAPDIETLRRVAPLPETTDEVCAVAAALRAPASDLYLGARATVGEIKRLAAAGRLADYRVIHFATHGLVAGGASDIEQGLLEPAILLTPPPPGTTGQALDEDRGLLTATDITGLRLNADWVVMSACNTAAGSATSAEPLAGLARAFFHAGARALLVSHWSVYSTAAVALTTRTFDEIARQPTIGKAEALRRAMSGLMAASDPFEAHPAYWAPFVLIGGERM